MKWTYILSRLFLLFRFISLKGSVGYYINDQPQRRRYKNPLNFRILCRNAEILYKASLPEIIFKHLLCNTIVFLCSILLFYLLVKSGGSFSSNHVIEIILYIIVIFFFMFSWVISSIQMTHLYLQGPILPELKTSILVALRISSL